MAAAKAYAMSGIKPGEADGVELHDCFSITEVVATELLGLAPMGRGGELAESGATALPQVRESLGLPKPNQKVIPVNAGGGLIADGHPVGGTGVRQVVEAATQLRGEAGARQITDAKTYLTFNMGGSLTTSVVMAWGRDS
jgi:acetyl-CoA C-acetyltransferase